MLFPVEGECCICLPRDWFIAWMGRDFHHQKVSRGKVVFGIVLEITDIMHKITPRAVRGNVVSVLQESAIISEIIPRYCSWR